MIICVNNAEKIRIFLVRARFFDYLNGPNFFDGSYVNKLLWVAITPNQVFRGENDFSQLVYVIQQFLFSCYKGIYKCKFVKSDL